MTNDDTINTTLDSISGIEPHYEHDPGAGWTKLIRRLQIEGISHGLSVITITVTVDECGNPLEWLEPIARHIEPKGRAEALMRAMAGEGE